MIENTTKAKLQSGAAVYGCFYRYPSASLAEFVALAGWDFLVFDAEHGTLDAEDLEHLARAAELRDVTPIARVTTNDPATILRTLDAGVHGVHVPWVNTADGADAAVRAVKYHPRGQRGLAGTRASRWGTAEPLDAYVRRANRETLVVIHIETMAAVEAIDEYLAVDGIDVLFLGPTDLSHSLGVPGHKDHPAVRNALEKVAEAVVGSRVALGIFAGTPAEAVEWYDRGARYFTTGLERVLAPGMRAYLDAVRS